MRRVLRFSALFIALLLSASVSAGTLMLPSGLQKIQERAFFDDPSLDEVILPEGIRSIGSKAFAWSGLRRINLPDSLEFIADDAFYGVIPAISADPESYAGRWALSHGYMRYSLAIGAQTLETAAGTVVKGVFTAPFTGLYSFYSTGKADTYGYMYDDDGFNIMHNDDSGEDSNFLMIHPLTAGETVILGVKYYNSAKYGPIEVVISAEPNSNALGPGDNTIPLGAEETAVCSYTASYTGTYTFIVNNPEDAEICPDDGSAEFGEFAVISIASGETARLLIRHTPGGSGSTELSVTGVPDDNEKTVYRALLIGQVSFTNDKCTRNASDVNDMAAMLRTVNGGEYEITSHIDLTRSGVAAAIASTFAGATDNDVSLFFYASHGVYTEGSQYGSLRTYDGGYIPTAEIAEWLSRIPGKVIVLVGTCGSGALIEKNSAADDDDEFSRLLIEAFASRDPGIISLAENAGELRQSKFYVMTASIGSESSYGTESGDGGVSYNFFTKWFIESAGGTSPVLTADTNKDGKLTLAESYAYVKAQADAKVFTGGKQQHPQVYPENSGFVLFTK